MCSHTANVLEGRIVQLLGREPTVLTRTLFASLVAEGVCLVHFHYAVLALVRARRIAAAAPGREIEPSIAPLDLLKETLKLGSAPAPSERVLEDRYRVLPTRLGSGSWGDVYLGEQIRLGRTIAIKFLSLDRLHSQEERAEFRERFHRESRILAQLSHPAIVQVIDCGDDGNECWYAMEYLRGGTLASRLDREGRIPPNEVVEYMLAASTALQAAVECGILHRDVKPGNIFNAPIKLADFGLSTYVAGGGLTTERPLTRGVAVVGTPVYMAPERCAGGKGDHRSDIYSLGATMYHAATGRLLFDLDPRDVTAWFDAHAHRKPAPIRELAPDCPAALVEIIERCLAKPPEDRPPSFSDVAAALRPQRVWVPKYTPPPIQLDPRHEDGSALMSSLLSVLDTEVLRISMAYEERYGVGCWTANETFQRALWRLARSRGLLEGLAHIVGDESGTQLPPRLGEWIDSTHKNGVPQDFTLDFREYVWTALRRANEQRAQGFVADTTAAEMVTEFLKGAMEDASLQAFLNATPQAQSATTAGAEPAAGAPTAAAPEAETPVAGATPNTTRRRPPAEVLQAETLAANCFSNFVLCQEVGRGGMGTVYRAWDKTLGRFVALKILTTADAESRERFLREGEIAARLQHPGIATVYSVGEVRGRCYIAMQYIDGQPIDGVIRPLREMLELVRDAAHALQYAHDQGVVHRDVKPGNLLVDAAGHVFLTDFGIAKEMSADFGQRLTTNMTVGTPEYMSPEQVRSDTQRVAGTTDVYSLGATLYELIAGRMPFVRPNLAELLKAVVEEAPDPLRHLAPEVSPELEEAVARAMAKDPARRFATAADFAAELDRLLREERFTGNFGRARQLARRWLPRAAVLIGLAIGGRALLLWAAPRPSQSGGAPLTYAAIALTISKVEHDTRPLTPELQREQLKRDVLDPLDALLARDPRHLQARVGRARAWLLNGDAEAVRGELDALQRYVEVDYRIRFLKALLAIESELGRSTALPAPDVPRAEWARPPSAWPASIADDLRSVASARVHASLEEEHRFDLRAAQGLLLLAESKYEEAARALASEAAWRRLPLFGAAWCRAAYLARQFREVASSPRSEGRPERIGAALALAFEDTAGEAALESLLPLLDDPAANVLAHVALARRYAQHGRDPGRVVDVGLALAGDGELRGVLLGARVRWAALSGADEEAQYRDALVSLGDAPSLWVARAAAVELRLGLASRRALSRSQARPLLEDAIARADALAAGARDPAAPRLLRCAARLQLGHVDDAWVEISDLVTPERRDPRVLLAAATVWLRFARQQTGADARRAADRAREFAMTVVSAHPENLEALRLAAAAAIAQAEQRFIDGADASEALQIALRDLNTVLERMPAHVDGRLHRARALVLRGHWEQHVGRDGRTSYEAALADLDDAISRVAALTDARYLRGIACYALGRLSEAVSDWERVQSDGATESRDLAAWIERARGEMKKP